MRNSAFTDVFEGDFLFLLFGNRNSRVVVAGFSSVGFESVKAEFEEVSVHTFFGNGLFLRRLGIVWYESSLIS